MIEYYILKREDCLSCRGSGITQCRSMFNPEITVHEIDCASCEGKGYLLEPIELTEDLLRSLIR